MYTKQKLKKNKTWQDGVLEVNTGTNKAVLLSDENVVIESRFVRAAEM